MLLNVRNSLFQCNNLLNMILIKAYFLPILLQTPWKLKAFFFSLQTFIVSEYHFNIYNFIIILFYIDFDHANKKKDI